MRVGKQLAVFLENKPGALARLCEALAEKKINLLAVTVSDTVDHAVVRMVVDRPTEALHALGEAGMLVVESDVLLIEVPNKPGGLAELAKRLSESDVNIEYAYCTSAEKQTSAMLVLRTHDAERAREVLGNG